MARFDLSDREWSIIAPLLPNKPRGVPRQDDRRVLNGIFYILRTGSPWRDLPERYGPYTTVYNRFNRWSRQGIWFEMFEALTGSTGIVGTVAIDSSHIKAHRSAAGGKGGLIDALLAARGAGSPVNFTAWLMLSDDRSPSISRSARRQTAKPMTP